MRASLAGLVLIVLLAGCASSPDVPGPTDGSDDPSSLRPRQVFEQEGNNPQCTDVLAGTREFSFDVDAGYNHIEVSWHASGLGNVGYEIRGPNGTVASVADYNPANQPCNHDHGAAPEAHPAPPGAYTIVVRNQGILGWHLQINELVGENATHEGH